MYQTTYSTEQSVPRHNPNIIDMDVRHLGAVLEKIFFKRHIELHLIFKVGNTLL